jgi:hypothetical protein
MGKTISFQDESAIAAKPDKQKPGEVALSRKQKSGV